MASINDLATAAVSALSPEAVAESKSSLTDSAGTQAIAGSPAGEATATSTGGQEEARSDVAGARASSSSGPGLASSLLAASERAAASDPAVSSSAGRRETGAVRGAFVVLEGLDRSGKTTQVKLLEQRFVELGRHVKVLRFPDRTTPIGQMIDNYLRSQVDMEDHVIHLLFSANRWEAVKTITSLLAAGTTVLCDRYYYSGMVYSAAKQNPSLSLAWARNPEVGLPRPDLVVFLDLDEARARARGGWGGEVYERAEMQRRVRALFLALSGGGEKELEGEGFAQEREDLRIVDAGGSVETVAERIWEVVRPRVEEVERGEAEKSVRRVQ